jgi:hypothetical protein
MESQTLNMLQPQAARWSLLVILRFTLLPEMEPSRSPLPVTLPDQIVWSIWLWPEAEAGGKKPVVAVAQAVG